MDVNSTVETKQYIVVRLGSEQFGIDIQYIDNIVRMQRITRVPKAQEYFKGVINLRGEVLPVMSLRLKFGLADDVVTNSTRIIIIKLEPQSAVGILVDSVIEVITMKNEDIESVTQNVNDEKAIYLSGIGKYDNELISLLNIAGVVIEKEAG